MRIRGTAIVRFGVVGLLCLMAGACTGSRKDRTDEHRPFALAGPRLIPEGYLVGFGVDLNGDLKVDTRLERALRFPA